MRIRFWGRGDLQTRVSFRGRFLASFLFIHASCAKVGDPLPPLVRIPPAVDAHLVQQGWDRVEILIPPVLGEIKEVEIYRECGSSLPAEFEGSLVAQVGVEDVVNDSVTGFFVIDDPKPVFDEPCRYQLRVRNEQGRRSPASPTLQMVSSPPPGAPTNLRADVQENQIVVNWDAPSTNLDGSHPASLVGYLVNSVHVVSGTQFVDKEVVFGKSASYSVQSIGKRENPLVLSPPSQPLQILPVDRFAPDTPTNLTVVSLDSRVQLLWDAVSASDLAGYFVYRGSDGDRLEKSSSLVTINRYVDPQPLLGRESYYAVTAVDKYGNESLPSAYVAVTVNP